MERPTFSFKTPAEIQDFTGQPQKQEAMNGLWNQNLNGFTQQGMLNNRWNTINTPETTNYYNPEDNNPPSTAASITWSPFPGRLAFNFPHATQAQLNKMADTGEMPADISDDPCNPSQGSQSPYFPYGPRGWQDEYCEWTVYRNSEGKITKVHFTCENPEYWHSLWQIDPNKVLELYQEILGNPSITLDDLSLPGVTDPITCGPVYNPLNKWNNGPKGTATGGGAIHLTSTPNTLQTEIGLATSSSVLRNNPSGTTGNTNWPSSEYNTLLCDGQFGQKHRNSDPNIGGAVNSFVNQAFNVTLANPPGLYIQEPDFSTYETPNGANAATFWKIVRGVMSLNDDQGNKLPGNFILHAVFEVPESEGYTVGDIKIGGEPIEWGSQIASTFKMQIVASAFAGTKPQGYDAVGDTAPADTFAQPLQLFYEDYFTAMYNIQVPNPVNNPISLLSNSTYVPPVINIGTTESKMVITAATCTAKEGKPGTYPSITFNDAGISATVTAVKENIYYAVPGNSMPSYSTAIYITVKVGKKVSAGSKSIYITKAGQEESYALPALLVVSPVKVQADIAWQNTGVQLSASETATITYQSGLWTANPNDNNGQLYDANGNPTFIEAKPGYTMPGKNEGALIGRIGDTVFFVGNEAVTPSGLSGEIQLCINDDLTGEYGAGLTDNIEGIAVQIQVN